MILDKTGYSYNDLTIVPAIVSNVSSRSQVAPFYNNGVYNWLPIFTAPMSTVVNCENINFWKKNKITPIIPRNISIDKRLLYLSKGDWVAFSMKEVKEIFLNSDYGEFNDFCPRICIDVANGHMQELISLCTAIKRKRNNNILIMTGNIANPETIFAYELAGIDYVRVSVGSGAGCLTSPQTSVHYPIASLIDQCYRYKKTANMNIKIIADGGIRNYGDVIKALALGADYVMIGSVFASLFESAGSFWGYDDEIFLLPNEDKDSFVRYSIWDETISEDMKQSFIRSNRTKTKVFYGMSTKRAQRLIKPDGENLKTSEGVEKFVDCTHTMKQWSENMEAYLRSAMSYCNAFKLDDFIGKVDLIKNSPAEIQAVNK